MERYRTSYFRSLVAAKRYYYDQLGWIGSNTERAVVTGSINIGMPPAREGWTVTEDNDGRYWMEKRD